MFSPPLRASRSLLISALFLAASALFGAGPTVTVKHEYGTIQVPLNPSRVVVFSYDILDTLDTLGVPVLGLPKSNVPAYLSRYLGSEYADLGSLFEPNFEKIYDLKPDVIFISIRQARLYGEFAKIAPTVYLNIDPSQFTPSLRAFNETLASLFGKEAEAKDLLANFEKRVAETAARARSSQRKALVLMVNDKDLSVFGRGSRFSMIYDGFGFAPADTAIEASTHGQTASFEYLKDKNPDVIFVLDRTAATGGKGTAAQVLDNPVVRSLNAFKNNRIVYLDGPAWYLSTGGLKAAAQMAADAEKGLR